MWRKKGFLAILTAAQTNLRDLLAEKQQRQQELGS